METLTSITSFVAGFFARLGLLLAIPVAVAVLVAVGMVVRRLAQLTSRRAAGLEQAGGMLVKAHAWYAPGHVWLDARGKQLRIGVDDLARRLLAEPRAIVLPEAGKALKKGEVAAVVTCGTKRVEIPSPVDGTVARRNEAVLHDPTLFGRQPYTGGWLFELEPTGQEWQGFPRDAAAKAWMQQEGLKLVSFAERELGVATADGGDFLLASANAIPEDKWERLLDMFVRGR